jgi:4-amino-4-deoxy-L-arabinose transferase-like glycosyltransferase
MDERRHRIALGAILAAAAVLPCIFFLGPRTVDHFLHAEAAFRMVHGGYRPSPWPQSMRYGILLPLAALQELLGVRPASAAVLTIAASVLHVFASYSLARLLFSPDAGIVAAALVTLIPVETIQATLLYPDLLLSALSAWGLTLMLKLSKVDRPDPRAVLAAGAVFATAYLVKQTVALPLLFLAGWILLRRKWRLIPAAAPVVVAIVAECLVIGRLTGDPFYRHTVSNSFLADMNQDTYGSIGAPALTLRFASLLWNPLDRGVPATAGLAILFAAAAIRRRNDPAVRFLTAVVLVELVLMTFWPVRLRPFVPAMIADERHALLLVAPMAAVVAQEVLALGLRARIGLGVGFAVLCLSLTAFLHAYLARADAGARAAFAELRARGATPIRAVDPYGRDSMLYHYLAGYAPSPEIAPYRAEDLPGLKATWVVLDGHSIVHRSGPEGVVTGPALFKLAPPGWEKVWEGTFPDPWDPRRRNPQSTEVRVYRVP